MALSQEQLAAGVPAAQARVQTDLLSEVMQAENENLNEQFSAKLDVTSELIKMNFEMSSFRQENKAALFALEQTLLTKIANTQSE